MARRRLIKRMVLRSALRRMAQDKSLTDQDRDDIRDTLRNLGALNALQDRVDALANDSPPMTGNVKGSRPFLDWLWEHRAEILAWIKEIIELLR